MAEEGDQLAVIGCFKLIGGFSRLNIGFSKSIKGSLSIGGQFKGLEAWSGLGIVGDLKLCDVLACFELKIVMRNIGSSDTM